MLTKKQLQLYRLMEDYKQRNGIMPSYEEMQEMIGLKSKSGVHRLITGMEARGVIRRFPNLARAIELKPLP